MTKIYNTLASTEKSEINDNTLCHDDIATLALWRGVVWQALRDLELYYAKKKRFGLEAYDWFFGEDLSELKEVCELGDLEVTQIIAMAEAVLQGTKRPRKLR